MSKVYQSRAGYVGGAVFLIVLLARLDVTVTSFSTLTLVLLVALIMIAYELWARSCWSRRSGVSWLVCDPRPWPVLLRSAGIRFLTNGVAFSLVVWLVHHHPYFRADAWDFTRQWYLTLFAVYALFGYPYHLLTLRYLGARRWDFHDYALLTLAGTRGAVRWLRGQSRGRRIVQARRVRQMALVYLVGLFFLTLMSKFMMTEYSAFIRHFRLWIEAAPDASAFYVYRQGYLTLYHLLFTLDVGIAVIGYSLASRWLDNRTKSVESTLYGWAVCLLCYPPMNSGFTSQFISYRTGEPGLITSEPGLMVLMALILACFTVYVWATLALGFRFSNLTNRGIVGIGPYRYFRHPSYTTKNLAWWLDNTHVWSSGWAVFALAVWSWIYVQRGMTEERHLSRDPAYLEYCQRVPARFVPCAS